MIDFIVYGLPASEEDIRRFRSFIDRRNIHPKRCWLWTGGLSGDGYGAFWINGKTLRAHRVVLELYGSGAPVDKFVLHTCDNRACVRPSHLIVGSHHDNMKDMRLKGRAASGERNGSRTHPERLRRGKAHYLYREGGCRNGHGVDHRFTDSKGGKDCKKCQEARLARSYAKRKGIA